jgi:nucleotide-binding universal stress UspA family protein
MTAQSRPVVIGVDGSAANIGALRFGVEEARRIGAPVKLVHVVPDYIPVSPMMPMTPVDLTETGTAILASVEERARELGPDLDISAWLHHGTRPVQLSQAAECGRVLVVGRDDRPLMERLLRGDTAAGVAARATVPLVVVPSSWTPGLEHGVVLVGVKSPTHATELLGDAMRLASERGAKVVVLHAWKLPSEYDDIIGARVAVEDWRHESALEMDALLQDWRRAYPDVEIEVRVVHDHAAHALLAASAEADIVVVVRRGHGVPASVHLGSVARALLRSGSVPVRIVSPDAIGPTPELVLEKDGALAR